MSVQALILSVDHRVFRGSWVEAPSLEALEAQCAELGLKVSSPVAIDPPRFAVLVEGSIPGESEGGSFRHPDWVPLARVLESRDDVWNFYCERMLGGWHPPKRSVDVFYFGSKGLMASQLAHLVAKGSKRLTAGWRASHAKTGMPEPEVGWVSIVTDGFGIPIACIATEEVRRLSFASVTEEMARLEGEGDLTLDDWKRGHRRYWREVEAPMVGLEFEEDAEIFVERFRLLKVFAGQHPVDRPEVLLPVGLTGSGKTTFAKRVARERGVAHFSIDEWMRRLYWSDAPSPPSLEWALERCSRCESMIDALLEQEIRAGRGAVLDLGFSKIDERTRWLKRCEELGATPRLVYIDVPREVRWSRVEARNRALEHNSQAIAVDRATFDWMEGYFEPLTDDELRLASVIESER